jgi:hypothetical protein
VLALCLVVGGRAFVGWRTARSWTVRDEKLQRAFIAALDLQFTVGLVLYVFLSPFSRVFFHDVAFAMKDSGVRFFGLEHVLGMLLAVSLVHAGRTRSMKTRTAAHRHRMVWGTTFLSLLVMCGSIPWPFLRFGRPLLRGWVD